MVNSHADLTESEPFSAVLHIRRIGLDWGPTSGRLMQWDSISACGSIVVQLAEHPEPEGRTVS